MKEEDTVIILETEIEIPTLTVNTGGPANVKKKRMTARDEIGIVTTSQMKRARRRNQASIDEREVTTFQILMTGIGGERKKETM